jgi:CheY-like chemotaxis protein
MLALGTDFWGFSMHTDFGNARARAWTERRVLNWAAPLHVLVVDDSESGAESVAAYLSLEAMECQIALGGVRAIEMGMAWVPDLIVMDISMPDLDGFETTQALRRDSRTGNILVLAFTSLDETEVFGHPSHVVFDGYCQKGQPPHVLVALIHTFLDHH